jgi:hypothetical protein
LLRRLHAINKAVVLLVCGGVLDVQVFCPLELGIALNNGFQQIIPALEPIIKLLNGERFLFKSLKLR